MDEWASRCGRSDIFAQIGPSDYKAKALNSFAFLDQGAFAALQAEARLLVSHAGMGSIITALELGKPIIILARDHRRGEHRNGHQIATLQQFRSFPGVFIADDEEHLISLLDRADSLAASPQLSSEAPEEFLQKLTDFIEKPVSPSRISQLRNRLSRRHGSA
ncbi:glycosyltransferase [Sphingobium yanoikuyae]|nr:glycosyltransferase [Sphingobium yanoikuyae]